MQRELSHYRSAFLLQALRVDSDLDKWQGGVCQFVLMSPYLSIIMTDFINSTKVPKVEELDRLYAIAKSMGILDNIEDSAMRNNTYETCL